MPTMTAASSVSLPGLQPCGLAWDGEAWWHADGTAHRVYRLDPADGAVRREYDVRGAMGGTAWGDGHVWQAIPAENRVVKLDPLSGEVVHTLSLGLSIVGVTWVDREHLAVTGHYEQALFLVDAETGEIRADMPTPERPGHVAWDGEAFWTGGAAGSGRLFRLEPGTGRILRVFEAWGDVRGLAWDGRRLWWVEGGDRRAYPVG
jgi:outer membrane protein assembly factor BamB